MSIKTTFLSNLLIPDLIPTQIHLNIESRTYYWYNNTTFCLFKAYLLNEEIAVVIQYQDHKSNSETSIIS